MIKFGFIGFGEAPYHLTKNFTPNSVEVYAFDVIAKGDSGKARKVREHASENKVTLVGSLAELTASAEIFLNFTSANAAIPIAREAAPLLREGQTYLDMNSTSPQTKSEVAALFAESKGEFVEAAVMSSVPANATRVPISLCGRTGAEISEKLNAVNMNTTFLSEDIGLASATKILRSVLAKGMMALITETVFATEHYGITETVFEDMRKTMLEEMTFRGFCDYSVASAAIHNGRFCHEMEEVLKTLDALGENSIMTQAALKKFEWLHAQGYADHFSERAATYGEVMEVKRRIEGAG